MYTRGRAQSLMASLRSARSERRPNNICTAKCAGSASSDCASQINDRETHSTFVIAAAPKLGAYSFKMA